VRSRTGLVALVILVLAVAVACTSDSASRSSSPASPTTAVHHATDTTVAPAAANASPKELGAHFEHLLGQHALLAMRLTRSEVTNASDWRQVVETSLEANTDALSQLVGTAYDDTQGERFKQLWQGYVTDLSAYANGAASQDASAKQAARASLMDYCDDYGAWLAGASNGQLQAGDAVRTARTRVQGLIEQVDAYAAGDYDQAYKIERQAYQNTFMAGATLAKASVTPKAAAALDAPPERLRSAFAMLLGEHMELIIDAQRATFAGSRSSRRPPRRSTPTAPPSPRRWGRSSAPQRPPSSSRRGPTTSRGCWPTPPRSPATTRPQGPRPRRTWTGSLPGSRCSLEPAPVGRHGRRRGRPSQR
jgi:hypothetical protein